MVIVGVFDSRCVLLERSFDDARGIAAQFTSIDVEGAFGPFEGAAAGASMDHADSIVVNELESRLGAIGRRDDAYGARVVAIHGPLGDIEMMGSHVGQSATGVFAVVAEGGEVSVHSFRAEDLVVASPGSGAEPEVPGAVSRGFELGEIAGDWRGSDADADGLEFPESAGADEVHGVSEASSEFTALLAAGLKDDVMFAGGFDQFSPFENGVGERFLAVDILLGGHGMQAVECVPVIG